MSLRLHKVWIRHSKSDYNEGHEDESDDHSTPASQSWGNASDKIVHIIGTEGILAWLIVVYGIIY